MSTQQTPVSSARQEGDATTPARGLITPEGSTTISDGVVSKVAETAAREVRGVHDLSSGVGGALRRLTPGVDERGSAASVEVGKKEAIVELELIIDYGVSIPQVAQSVRENVIDRVEYMTGLSVKQVNIEVTDLFFAEEERRKQQQQRDREPSTRVE